MTDELITALNYYRLRRSFDDKYNRHPSPLETGKGSRNFLSESLPCAAGGGFNKLVSSSRETSLTHSSPSLAVRDAGLRLRSRRGSLFSSGSRSLIGRSLAKRRKSYDGSVPESSTDGIDSTLARIHLQLTQFSEEDKDFKERIERLSVQINELHDFHIVQRIYKYQEVEDEQDSLHSCPPEPTRQDTVSPQEAQPLPTYYLKNQQSRNLSLGQIDSVLMEMEPEQPNGSATCATLKQVAIAHRSSIDLLRVSSLRGRLMPVEEAWEASNEAGGVEEGIVSFPVSHKQIGNEAREGERWSKLSSIESRSGTDTPLGQWSETSSRKSSAASSVIPDIDMMMIDRGQDSEGLLPRYRAEKVGASGVKEGGALHTPQSATEDEVFLTLCDRAVV